VLELIRVGAKRSANLGTKKSANRSYADNNLNSIRHVRHPELTSVTQSPTVQRSPP